MYVQKDECCSYTCTRVHNIMCVTFFYSQAEAVLLRDIQHFLLQFLTRLREHD